MAQYARNPLDAHAFMGLHRSKHAPPGDSQLLVVHATTRQRASIVEIVHTAHKQQQEEHKETTQQLNQQTLPEYISYANWRISGHQHENELVTKIQVCGSTIDSLQFLEHVFISAAQQLLGEGAWIHIVPLAGGPPR